MWFLSFSFPNPVSVNISFTYYEKGTFSRTRGNGPKAHTFQKGPFQKDANFTLGEQRLALGLAFKVQISKMIFLQCAQKSSNSVTQKSRATAWPKNVSFQVQQYDPKMFLFKCNSVTQKCFFSRATVWPKNVSFKCNSVTKNVSFKRNTVTQNVSTQEQQCDPKTLFEKNKIDS
jgi:hypothetical protein